MGRRTAVWTSIFCLLLGGCMGVPPDVEGGLVSFPHSVRPVVKIGLVAPFEGRYRSLGYETLYAVKLAVRERNAAGGVAGHMVELVALDGGDDPEGYSFQAHKFAVDERVMGLVGPFSEGAVRAIAPACQELGLATITPATCGSNSQSSPGAVFCLGAGVDTVARAVVERLPAGASVTLLRAGRGTLGDHLLSAGGQVLAAPWDTALTQAIRERPADVYLYDGDVLGAADLLVKMRQAGIEAPIWGGPSLARTQLSQIAGGAAAGSCYAMTAPLWADLGAQSDFVGGYQELSAVMPGPWAALAYDGTVLLLDALGRAITADGSPTRAGVIAALAGVQGPDGKPLFDHGQRRQAEVNLYCYEPGDGYPGTLQRR